jgi:L-malate glycosyltransferase
MPRIKVLHLIKGLNRGGAEMLLLEGLRFSDRERFEYSYGYFSNHLAALAPDLAAHGAELTCFGGRNHAAMLRRTLFVARELKRLSPDLVHCHMPLAGVIGRIAGRMTGIPVMYTEHNKPEWYRRPTFYLNAWTYNLQRHVIAVSGSVEQSIHSYMKPSVPVTVVRNGIDVASYTRIPAAGAAVRERFRIPPGAKVVGNVAALIPQKRLHDWIRAAQQIHRAHPDTRFLIVGEGPHHAELTELAAELGLTGIVHLCGVQADVRPFLSAMDVYMMSSAFEGLPVAMLEAMAAGCVPVCTAVGGIPEVIDEGRNGFLTVPGRPEELAARVSALISDPAILPGPAEAARTTVEQRFTIEGMVRAVESIYLDVLAMRPRHEVPLPAGRALHDAS